MALKPSEIAKLITVCSANYRGWPENGKIEPLVEIWSAAFANVDYKLAQMAVMKHMSESPYPPTMSDLKGRLADILSPQSILPIEGWGEVKRAIRKFGYMREAEAMLSLNDITRQVVEHMGFQTLCKSEDEMADRAHFERAFKTIVERKRSEAVLLPGQAMLHSSRKGELE